MDGKINNKMNWRQTDWLPGCDMITHTWCHNDIIMCGHVNLRWAGLFVGGVIFLFVWNDLASIGGDTECGLPLRYLPSLSSLRELNVLSSSSDVPELELDDWLLDLCRCPLDGWWSFDMRAGSWQDSRGCCDDMSDVIRAIESTEKPNTCLVGCALSLGDMSPFLGDLRERKERREREEWERSELGVYIGGIYMYRTCV